LGIAATLTSADSRGDRGARVRHLGIVGKPVGVLLWPAAAMHLLLTGLLATERVAASRRA
jgi:hypothetical protein